MSKLKDSFEPENYASMIEDYNVMCDKLLRINSIGGNMTRKVYIQIKELENLKAGFEKQFDTLNIEYTKR